MNLIEIKKLFNKHSNCNFFKDFTFQEVEDAKKKVYFQLLKERPSDSENIKKFLDNASNEIMEEKFMMGKDKPIGVSVKNTVMDNLNPNYKNTILFSGFQAGGTRGDRMIRGEKEIKMFGQLIQIKAEVTQISNLSAHADYQEMLIWLSHLKNTPRKIFITHGEEGASDALKAKVEHEFNWDVEIPTYLDQYELK